MTLYRASADALIRPYGKRIGTEARPVSSGKRQVFVNSYLPFLIYVISRCKTKSFIRTVSPLYSRNIN